MDSSFYNDGNLMQNKNLQNGFSKVKDDLIKLLCSNVTLSTSSGEENNFTYVDYAGATGNSTAYVYKEMIGLLEGAFKNFQIIINDLPSNDFRLPHSLFKLILDKKENVFVNFSIGSFTENLTQPNSVNLATCFNAIHWIETSKHHNNDSRFPQFSKDKEVVKIVTEQAKINYQNFIQNRNKELKSGGCLVLISFLNKTLRNHKFMELIWEFWTDFVKKNEIEKLQKYLTLPFYLRTQEELLAPFVKDLDLKLVTFQETHSFYPTEPTAACNFLKPFIAPALKELLNSKYILEYEKDYNNDIEKFIDSFFNGFKTFLEKEQLDKEKCYFDTFVLLARKV
jgi:hypothetical protein